MYKELIDLQMTVGAPFALQGVGIHSGRAAKVTVEPACEGGIRFSPLGAPTSDIPAHISSLRSTMRCTVLANGTASVATTEHLLAALWAFGVDHARVVVDGEELPALDGSALPYVEALQQVGLRPLERPREWLELPAVAVVSQQDAHIVAVPADTLRVTYVLEYDHPLVGTQVTSVRVNPGEFAVAVAPARTFGFAEWAKELKSRGLALGASLENTILVERDRVVPPLRFPDEFARHKILDLVGDLALLGRPLRAHVIAVRSGHALNAMLVRHILDQARFAAASPKAVPDPETGAGEAGCSLTQGEEASER